MSNLEASAGERARFFDVSPTPLAVVGFDGSIRHVNPAWSAQVEGIGPGSSLLLGVAPDGRAALVAALAGLRQGGATSLRLRLRGEPGGEGRLLVCELSAEPGGACVYCAARPSDEPAAGPRGRTEQVNATLIRALDQTESIGLYMVAEDEHGELCVRYANAGAARIARLDDLQARARAADLLHADVQKHVDGKVAPGVVESLSSAPREHYESTEFETRLQDGRSVLWLVRSLGEEPGGLRGWLFVGRDITERRHGEQAAREAHERLRRSEREFRRLLEHVPDGIVVMRDGKFAYANPAAARILGHDAPEDLIGVHFASIVRPEELSESDERVRLMSGAAPPPRRVRPMVRRDGSTVYAETLGFATELDGEPATLVIAHDVTEERRLEAQIRQAERLASLGTISATIAHEINNPLTYILLNLQLAHRLLGQLAAASPSPRLLDVGRLVEQSLEGSERVRVIVSQLRDFARADEQKTALVDVRTVLDSILPMAEHELGGRAVVRAYDQGPPEPRVRANAVLLGHVFLNLLVNAAQAFVDPDRSRQRIQLEVRTEHGPEGDRVIVAFRDNGKGMPREVQERIFEPFFTTKPAGVGTGLGLSLCLQRVRALGGDIAVESEVGLGSAFTVTLPLGLPGAEPEVTAAKPAELPRARILIVDDEPRIAQRLAELLSAHEVEVAESGRAALARLFESPFDAVFCDLMMPDLKGTEVFEAACRAKPELVGRFIFMTAGAFTPSARALLDRVGNPRLDKPFTEAEVQKVLALVVTRPRGG